MPLFHKQSFREGGELNTLVGIILLTRVRDEVVCLRAGEEEEELARAAAVSHVRMIFVVWALVFTSRPSSNKHK